MNRWEIVRELHRKGYGDGDENLTTPAGTIIVVHGALSAWLAGSAGQNSPDSAVLLDTLRLVPGAHEDLDRAELDITAALRGREVPWEEIGAAFNYREPGRRQAAAARNSRLRRRYPYWTAQAIPPEEG